MRRWTIIALLLLAGLLAGCGDGYIEDGSVRGYNNNFNTARAGRGCAPINLLKFAFAAGDVYLSDRDVSPQPANLVTNGDMELDSDWSDKGTPTVNERSSTQAYNGTYSRHFTTDAYGEGIVSAPFTTITDGQYTIGAWVYSVSATDVILRTYKGDGTLYLGFLAGVTPGSWSYVEWTATQPQGGSLTRVAIEGNGAGTEYYIDDVVVRSVDVFHSGIVKQWGFIDSSVSGQSSGAVFSSGIEVPDLEIVLINSTSPPFSDYFTVAAPPEGVEVTLYQRFDGLDYEDAEEIFVGQVSGQPRYDEQECRLLIKGGWSRYDVVLGNQIISADDWPSADPDDIGKSHNTVIGSCRNVVARALTAGVMDSLRDDLSPTAVSFYVSQAGPVQLPAGTVVVQIDQEQIQGSYNQTTGQLTGCTRDPTTAAEHNRGAAVVEILTEYVYEVAGHPVQALGDVRVGGVKVVSGYTGYTGQAGDELTGYEGRAVVAFATLPQLKRQVNIIATTDEGSHSHSSSEQTLVWDFDTFTVVNSSGVFFPECLCDNDLSTFATLRTQSGQVRLGKAKYAELAGQPAQYRVCVRTGIIDPGGAHTISFGNAAVGTTSSTDNSTIKSSWRDVDASKDTWAEFNDIQAYVTCTGSTANTSKLAEVWVEIKTTPTISTGPATGVNVTLSGNSTADTVIGGRVTVDVDGAIDDGVGTITGVADTMVARCDHVFDYLLTVQGGFPRANLGASFATAGTFFSTNSYAFAFVIDRPIKAGELLQRLAIQCRSRFLVSPIGEAKLLVRQTGQSSGHSIATAEIRRGSVVMRRSPADQICNNFAIKYDRDWATIGPDAYNGAVTFSDATSQARYGVRDWQGGTIWQFDAVSDHAMVDHVGAYWLARMAYVLPLPQLHIFLDNMEIEAGDIIDITHDLDGMSGFVVEVVGLRHVLGSARQQIIDRLEITTEAC